MSYQLSFGPEFFYAAGEPYDAVVKATRHPKSVWQAIISLRAHNEAWEEMALALFGVPGDRLDPETVMDKVQETNLCGQLGSPVDVWIDPDGFWTLEVYDE